jgi:predicted MFS family arabinose efflux permease
MLMLVFAVQYLNRQVPVLLAQSIKAEFALSDAQLGLLTGFVFSIPYVLMMFPVGFLVDRGNRRNILLVGLTVWSGLTTLTGLVRSLTELMLIRVCIAAAEGVNNPTSLSIISDLYDRKSRATAVGFLFAGPAIGSIIGFPLVAFIADRYGWRVGYFAAGLPGIILAVVFYLTIREPQREESAPGKEGAAPPPLGETLRFLWTQRSSLHLMAGMMLTTIITSGNIAWMMPLLMRGHAISLSQASLIVSLAWGVANAIGQMSGGALADWLARRDIRWHAWLPACSALGGGLLMIGSSLVPNTGSAVVLLGLWSLSVGFQYGPVLGTLQGLVRPRMRGVASSCMTLLINLVGAGGGPLLVGVLSDHFSGWHGITSIQWALATVALLQVWPLVHFLRAAHFLRGNIARIEQNAASSASPA